MRPTVWVVLGSLCAATAVALGAIGAHVLKSRLGPEQLETYQTAVQYQMYHGLGLVLVGVLGLQRPSRWLAGAGCLMLLGILLFSGFLYAWVATANRSFVHPVPVGGVAFILGWLMLAVGVARWPANRPS